MLYLNQKHIEEIGIDWVKIVALIAEAAQTIERADFAQPIKPYLRYKDLTNRIIAMPAYLGGEVNLAGIKWIASFPGNIHKDHGIPRANSVTVLNDADTGQVKATINTTIVSGIRTSAVTGYLIHEYLKRKGTDKKFTLGMTGFGPIGQLHLSMALALLGDSFERIDIYDLRPIDEALLPAQYRDKINIVSSWQEAYADKDIFMTCTVSKKPYVDIAPKKGSLQLNISLRDYVPEYLKYVDVMVVDDWEEICRENTDVENMHKSQGLTKEDTASIGQLAANGGLQHVKDDDVIMFNPMGMAAFDIAVGSYYYNEGIKRGIGVLLEA